MPYFEPGKYEVEIAEQGFGKSEKAGTPFFFVGFTPAGAKYQQDIRWYLKTDKNVEIFVEQLELLGVTWLQNFSDLDTSRGGTVDLRGRTVTVECFHETDPGGVIRDRWQLPFSGDSTPYSAPELSEQEARKLQTLFGKKLPKEPPASEPAAQPTPDIANADLAKEAAKVGDDIPF